VSDSLNWGILGTGSIAGTLAEAINTSQTGKLVAVGSRSQASADTFGQKNNAAKAYDSYAKVLEDPDVQAVYIALPNNMHTPWAIKCAEAGKHILSEKPIALNRTEAQTAIDAAAKHDVFLMEAFMYRTHPNYAKLVGLIRDGAIGTVRLVQSTFGFDRPLDGDCRLVNSMGGGGIMDVGCYTVGACRLIAGAAMGKDFANPLEVNGCAYIDPKHNVDLWASAALKFDGDIMGSVACGMQVLTDWSIHVWGTAGNIKIQVPWFPSWDDHRMTLTRKDAEPEQITSDTDQDVYAIQVDTVAASLANRQAPAPCMTWDDTLGNMQTLDMWRASVGLHFEGEM
jgi:predicted dehydrogenase